MDLSHLPKSVEGNSQIWVGRTSLTPSTTQTIHTFIKPRGITMMSFLVIGAGGQGGSGSVSGGSIGQCGGGGGGSGAVTALTIASNLIPDLLYVSPGDGGYNPVYSINSNVANNGTSGSSSWISIMAAATGSSTNLISANGGVGGSGGTLTNASGGAGGAASTTDTWGNLGNYVTTAGQIGGTAGIPGFDITWSFIVSGGGRGDGGSITGAGIMPTITGGQRTVNSGRGNNGIWFRQPLISSGGSGGASDQTASGSLGGQGGDGAFGSGGGGGGSGRGISGSSSVGGRGGPGLIFVSWW